MPRLYLCCCGGGGGDCYCDQHVVVVPVLFCGLNFVQIVENNIIIENNQHGPGLNHIAFMGGSLTDLDNLESQLISKDVKILKRNGSYLCFENPNSFASEVYAK